MNMDEARAAQMDNELQQRLSRQKEKQAAQVAGATPSLFQVRPPPKRW